PETQIRLLDVREVVTLLGVSEAEFRRKCSAGEFPAPDGKLPSAGTTPRYGWLPETVAPWAECLAAKRAAETQRKALAHAAKSTWARGAGGHGVRHKPQVEARA
ncbi:helix-turn-helix transcriptional regulator, partial [Burkholderia thailandensis]|uniref:helix-turn-helix transcriptional regulator n=1 Tax=Burkholderia thailandensis TaxID=57975 RepID=UPI001E2DD813